MFSSVVCASEVTSYDLTALYKYIIIIIIIINVFLFVLTFVVSNGARKCKERLVSKMTYLFCRRGRNLTLLTHSLLLQYSPTLMTVLLLVLRMMMMSGSLVKVSD